MAYEQIAYDVEDRVATITFDRPEQLNAYTDRMLREVLDAMDRVDADDGVRAVVFTGRGRAFCAGADLSAGAAAFDVGGTAFDMREHADGGGILTRRLHRSTKPLIAAINGPAVGIGITSTLPMDFRLASTTARMGFVFTRRGVVPEACSSWFLPRLVGIAQALDWVITGRVFDAEEALRGGLVRSLHAPEELLPAAYALAREIAENTSAASVAISRMMLWQMLGERGPEAAHEIDSRGIFHMGKAPDAAEGVTAFLQKRPAQFTMRVPEDLPAFVARWQAAGSVDAFVREEGRAADD
jgi:enoyl-CoA hydratase/carnithine racemase